MTRYIILNGPPGSGKSSIARELSMLLDKSGRTVMDSFNAPIKHFLAAALSDPYGQMDKERQRPELNGESVHHFLDKLEGHLRGTYGEDILGRWLVHRTLKHPHKKPAYVIIDDGNCHDDIRAVPNRFVVHVYRMGRAFNGNGFYPDHHFSFRNNATLAHLWSEVLKLKDAINAKDSN